MSDPIYIIETSAKQSTAVDPCRFSEWGVRERRDLQEWIASNPKLLGEELLIVAKEFSAFDRSNKRLDLLAIDKTGTLCIVELKLELDGSLADLQAIRYAAFCSTMSRVDVIRTLADTRGISISEAERDLDQFVEGESFVLAAQPRIILAAGRIDDQELTAAVMWLRRFGVDITCVELTPYRLAPSGQLIVVPRVIIPIAEAKDFLIRVERREAAEVEQQKAEKTPRPIFAEIARRFNSKPLDVNGRKLVVERVRAGRYQSIQPYFDNLSSKSAHYEWVIRKQAGFLDVAVHFESQNEADNDRLCRVVEAHRAEITKGVSNEFTCGAFGDPDVESVWREARFRIPADDPESPELAQDAVDLMRLLITRTYSALNACTVRK